MTRKYSSILLEMINDGVLDQSTVILACLDALSDTEVRDMMEANEFLPEFIEDDDYEFSLDGDHESALASAGWGTDEDYGYCGTDY